MFIARLLYLSVIQMLRVERFFLPKRHIFIRRAWKQLHILRFHHKRQRHTPKLLISLHRQPFSAIHQILVYVCGAYLPALSGFRRQHVGMMESFHQFANFSKTVHKTLLINFWPVWNPLKDPVHQHSVENLSDSQTIWSIPTQTRLDLRPF